MLRKEWSLMANSILIQLACGLFTFLAFYRQGFFNRAGGDDILAAATCGMIWAGPIILTAMILSLFHLGRPYRACRAITHLRGSPLSREVFFTGVFFALWGITAWMDASGSASMLWVWLTAAAGLLSILSMSGIYAKTGRPGWKGTNPYLHFFGTFIIFGVIGSSLILNTTGLGKAISPALPVLALLILVIRLLYAMLLFKTLQGGKPKRSLDQLVAAAPVPLENSIMRLHRFFTLWGWCLSFASVAMAFTAVITHNTHAGLGFWTVTAALVLTGEILQRMGFNSLGLDRVSSEIHQRAWRSQQ